MAGNFLRKWFGGSRPASLRGPEIEKSVDEARAELDRLAGERPLIGPLCQWLRELLPDLADEQETALAVTLTAEEARMRLAEGIPLLRGVPLSMDGRAFRRRWERACAALQAAQPEAGAANLAEALRRGRLEPDEMVRAVLAGQPEHVHDSVLAVGADPALALTLLRYTLFPTFVALEKTLTPLHENAGWAWGYCPTCGTWPLLGEYRGLDQSRHLRCGLCAASWEVPRLWCAYCGSRDHEKIRYLHAEGEETRYRAVVCDDCRGYVKMVSTLSALPPLRLPVADLFTLYLDLAAAERNYTNQP